MMHFPFTYDMYDQPSGTLLAQIELRAEVHGIIGDWFLGALEVVDLNSGEWREIGIGTVRQRSALYNECWRLLNTPAMRQRIDLDYTAHCDAHGEDGLLDVMERALDHKRAEGAP